MGVEQREREAKLKRERKQGEKEERKIRNMRWKTYLCKRLTTP